MKKSMKMEEQDTPPPWWESVLRSFSQPDLAQHPVRGDVENFPAEADAQAHLYEESQTSSPPWPNSPRYSPAPSQNAESGSVDSPSSGSVTDCDAFALDESPSADNVQAADQGISPCLAFSEEDGLRAARLLQAVRECNLRAARLLQASWRRRCARKVRKVRRMKDRERRLIRLLCAVEHAKAKLVQVAWRRRRQQRLEMARRRVESAATRICAVTRGHYVRRQETRLALATVVVAAMRLQRHMRRHLEGAALRERCRGVLLKQATMRMPLPLGLEARAWYRRYVCLTPDAIHYARLVRKGRARGAVELGSSRLIRYCDVMQVTGQMHANVMVVHERERTGRAAPYEDEDGDEDEDEDEVADEGEAYSIRTHRFHLGMAEGVEWWTASLLRLCELAGHSVPGALEVDAARLSDTGAGGPYVHEGSLAAVDARETSVSHAVHRWPDVRRRSLEVDAPRAEPSASRHLSDQGAFIARSPLEHQVPREQLTRIRVMRARNSRADLIT